ncbi:MAG: hypothetical protein AB1405_03650 [Bdellovibrionota bacterium]
MSIREIARQTGLTQSQVRQAIAQSPRRRPVALTSPVEFEMAKLRVQQGRVLETLQKAYPVGADVWAWNDSRKLTRFPGEIKQHLNGNALGYLLITNQETGKRRKVHYKNIQNVIGAAP